VNEEELSRLKRRLDYYQVDAPDWVRIIWKNRESFEWFAKNNRQTLLARGALVRLGRDYFIDTGIFTDVAKSILGVTKNHSDAESPSESNLEVSNGI